jgi:hypothetical protein
VGVVLDGASEKRLAGARVRELVMLPDFERVCCDWLVLGNPATRAFGELLIDCEEDRTLRAVLVGNAAGGREVIAARAGGPHTSGGVDAID